MLFSEIKVAEAQGALLAHSLKTPKGRISKGKVLGPDEVSQLCEAGYSLVWVARLENGDVHEDYAAAVLSAVIAGVHVEAGEACGGRVYLYAQCDGLLALNVPAIHAFNNLDEVVALSTLPPLTLVRSGQVVGTLKIIPFGVSGERAERLMDLLTEELDVLLRIRPFARGRVALIQTHLPDMPAKVLDKTLITLGARLDYLSGDLTLACERRCEHDVDELAQLIITVMLQADCDLLIISTASATSDRDDVLPAAIRRAGGSVTSVGMPVDPGNLLVLGELGGTPVIGMPGCARSLKLNGFDWVLRRLLAGMPVTRSDVAMMGVGGLPEGFATRPDGRNADAPRLAVHAAKSPVSAVILAAGQSRRMGAANKLLLPWVGEPLVRHIVRAALSSRCHRVVVVLGHEGRKVRQALADLPVEFTMNDAYAEGIGSSVRVGANTVDKRDGVVFCLGDMPKITAGMIDRLIAAYETEPHFLGFQACHGRKRGNPVLWSPACLPLLRLCSGDEGAKGLLQQYGEAVMLVDVGAASVIEDMDTSEDYDRLLQGLV
ncbi:NTP transferase domain-containing protein [Pseudomonas sp. 5Ae-yellow]|uniref:NTP transferase domain-containing protein n=1 Tax=Pseudomonas sp. 5Ae-yellow TaxID=2759848 RepID=UPI0015F5FB25|nr:molybdopterin-binding/glycosyltransferase family 2 protein [Pseudomonas sp. 5Ae-yellow]MBA6420983.1 NTP transferase domain-containing protein [Pseudomonas sp. 5Ae-yellow]